MDNYCKSCRRVRTKNDRGDYADIYRFVNSAKIIISKGNLVCACCGYTDIRFLNLDHIDSRKSVPSEEKQLGSVRLLEYIKSKGFLKGYQVLCYNCNFAKSDKPYCPHELDRMKK